MSGSRLSVVIPTRARDQALARCLSLLEAQAVSSNAEIIVTDDGLSETTRRMIEARFPFAAWTSGPQRGPAANRNQGASRATGDFIVFLDDDVEPSPDLLAAYTAAIRSDVNVYEGRTTCRAGIRSPLEQAPVNETGGWLWSCNMMVRCNFWRAFGGFDEDFRYPHLEDVIFRERLRASDEPIFFVPTASVDHPPRRRPSARTLAYHNEGYFIYQYKYLGTSPSMRVFFGELIRHRLRNVLRHRLSADSAVALGSMCIEVCHILARWHRWDRRWRGTKGAATLASPRVPSSHASS